MLIGGRYYPNYQTWLSEELRTRKASNRSYSMRSFAKYLGVGAASLSDVLNCKRALSYRSALKVAEKLMLSPQEVKEFLGSISKSKLPIDSPSAPEVVQISEDEFRLISEWYHLAIIQLAQTKEWDGTYQNAAYRLQITDVEARRALYRMTRMGYFTINNNYYELQQKSLLKTTHGIPSSAIRKYHKQNLKLAEKALESIPVELRNFNSVTIAIDPKRLDEANQEIQKFKLRMRELLGSSENYEVYTLGIQLFPVSRSNSKIGSIK